MESFKIFHKHSKTWNWNRKIQSTDQSKKWLKIRSKNWLMKRKCRRNSVRKPKAKFLHASKDETNNLNDINFNFVQNSKNFSFFGSELDYRVNYNYNRWRANNKLMDYIKKRIENPENLRLVQIIEKFTKSGNFRFKFETNLNRVALIPQGLDKRDRDEKTSLVLELNSRCSEKIRWISRYFKLEDEKTSTGKRQKKTSLRGHLGYRKEQN